MGKLSDGAASMGQSDGRKASRIKNPRDFWSGLMFLVIGASFAIGSTAYRFGYSAKPGPGYFPFGLGILLALLGVLILVKSLGKTSGKGEAVGAFAWRPLLMLAAAVVFWRFAEMAWPADHHAPAGDPFFAGRKRISLG